MSGNFIHQPIEYKELITYHKGDERFYITPDGDFRSVTTWLNDIVDKTFLEKWRNTVGEETADQITAIAASQGSAVHSLLEGYLRNEPFPDRVMPSNLELFRKAQPILDTFVDVVYGLEFPLWNKDLQLAGRVDLFCNWAGKDCVADFKTGRSEKHPDQMLGYFFQSSLYSFMLSQFLGRKLDHFVIIYLCPEGKGKVIIRPVTKYLSILAKETQQEAHFNEIFFGSSSHYSM